MSALPVILIAAGYVSLIVVAGWPGVLAAVIHGGVMLWSCRKF